jgi:hypothetical protein
MKMALLSWDAAHWLTSSSLIGELQITRRISLVAVCCSSASNRLRVGLYEVLSLM